MQSPKRLVGGMSLLIFDGNFNKNYRFPFERWYGRRIFKNHEYRKLSSEKGMRTSPTKSEYRLYP